MRLEKSLWFLFTQKIWQHCYVACSLYVICIYTNLLYYPTNNASLITSILHPILVGWVVRNSCHTNLYLNFFQSGSFGTLPNLRSLELQLGASNWEEDLSSLLRGNPALRRLHLHLSPSLVGQSAPSSSSSSGVLRHTLQREPLPSRLSEVTVEGEEVVDLHPAAFKQLRSLRVRLRFLARRRLSVDRDVFLNLGRAQNVTVEVLADSVDVHNASMHLSGAERRLGNPATTYSPGHPRAVFLEGLRLAGNAWDCDCDGIG